MLLPGSRYSTTRGTLLHHTGEPQVEIGPDEDEPTAAVELVTLGQLARLVRGSVVEVELRSLLLGADEVAVHQAGEPLVEFVAERAGRRGGVGGVARDDEQGELRSEVDRLPTPATCSGASTGPPS
jgi:hypothetical protein